MRYLGGKSRLAKKIAAVIEPTRRGRPVWDAFCGGLSSAEAFADCGAQVWCSDVNPSLIALYEAVLAERLPEDFSISEEEYAWARGLPDLDPYKALAGFGASFGGKWFGGYARGAGRNYVAESCRALNRQVGKLALSGVEFTSLDFLAFEPYDVGAVLYLDPPYAGVTEYREPFDSTTFWCRAAAWSRYTDVWVSEYAAPPGWLLCGEWAHSLQVSGGQQKSARVERLFYRGP